MASTDDAAAAPPAPRPYLAIPAALLVLIAGWEIVATLRASHSVPDDAAWAKAAAYVREQHQPGDLIVVAPGWADPIGRLHLGDLISIEDAARMDAARYGRIWELSIRGAHAPDVAGLTPTQVTTGDGVTVRRYERTPAVVVSDVRSQLATARSDRVTRPPMLELAEVGFAPHRCIQVVPQPGKLARIVFPRLALGSELVGYVGISDVFTRRDLQMPAYLAVEIGGNVVARASAGVDDGWVRFSTPTTPGETDVTFVVASMAANRLICFAAEARK